jgi:hypothetical protein
MSEELKGHRIGLDFTDTKKKRKEKKMELTGFTAEKKDETRMSYLEWCGMKWDA